MFQHAQKLLGLSVFALLVACGGEQSSSAALADAHSGTIEATPASPGQVDTTRIIDAAQQPAQWMTYSGGYEEQRHSGLTALNRDTLSELGVGWTYEMHKTRGVEATPVVVDGVMVRIQRFGCP